VINRAVRTIDWQAQHLTQLMEKLLDVTRIEAGKLQLEPTTIDLGLVVRTVVSAAQSQGTNGPSLDVSVSGDCSALLDPVRIEQVVRNLLSNAIKYSPPDGAIDIRVSGTKGTSVRFEVRDHGAGIPLERRAQLFNRFYQAHGHGYLSGLGLGLYISRQIVELHGGRIKAEFPSDGGTRMVVTLPSAAGHSSP
jgi:signal transduction histidine kinase